MEERPSGKLSLLSFHFTIMSCLVLTTSVRLSHSSVKYILLCLHRSLHPTLTTRKKPWKQIPKRKNWKTTREKRRERTNQERTRKSRKKRRKSRRQKRTSKKTLREKVTRRWKIKEQLKI